MSKKLDCKIRKKLNAYLDNEIPENEYIEIKDHLLSCPECQAEIRELNRINEFLNDFQEEDVPIGVKTNIMNAVSEISESSIKTGLRISKLSIAASIAASFLFGLLFSNITFTSDTESDSEFSLGQESLYSYYVTE